jgi:CTP synthase
MTKYIFVTGGVTSSLGKGIIAASLAKLLQARGLKVTIQKFDPYINIDPGTLNPYEHGECYVTEDGAETDLDLGHYERFLNVPTSQANNVTTGRIYSHVIEQERAGAYLGKTVQVVPHITDEIKRRMLLLGQSGEYDIVITELGGTVGDIESLPFIEAVRQLRWELGNNDSLVIHLTLVPYLAAAGELKTKPTQHSVKTLLEYGVQPDILVCRTEHKLNNDIRKKLALFCNVNINAVVESIDAPTIYDVPLNMLREQLDKTVLAKLKLSTKNEPDLENWKSFLGKLKNPTDEVNIGLVGKYVELPDAYKSIAEAFIHAGATNETKVKVKYIAAESVNQENVAEKLKGLDGVLVAPGFGERGLEGKLETIRFVRENKVPFFGICLGMQCSVIEFGSHSLILAATNHVEILDYALFRRFDDVIEYRLPTAPQATKLLQSRLGKFAPKPFPLKALTAKAEGLSYAEIKRAVDEAIKEAVMHDEDRVKPDVLTRAFDERRKFSLRMNNKKVVPNHAGSITS